MLACLLSILTNMLFLAGAEGLAGVGGARLAAEPQGAAGLRPGPQRECSSLGRLRPAGTTAEEGGRHSGDHRAGEQLKIFVLPLPQRPHLPAHSRCATSAEHVTWLLALCPAKH